MITHDYVTTMAAYNRWQNASLCRAASGLDDARRREDRGAFFGSVHATLSHLVWADTIWLHRFNGRPKPNGRSIAESLVECPDWKGLLASRAALDDEIVAWADGLDDATLAGDIAWHSASSGRDFVHQLGFLVTHFFNHQIHHRGQVHAMLTAMGARPGDTDLPLMPRG